MKTLFIRRENMKVKGVRLYAADDIRLEEFELPEIQDDEILVKVMSDSICMSTWKMIKQGAKHKRVPADVAENPIIIGHEFAGDIVKVGKKWQNQFKPGQKFAQQPAIPGQAESPGYSYTQCGGAATYCISQMILLKQDVCGLMTETLILKLRLQNLCVVLLQDIKQITIRKTDMNM